MACKCLSKCEAGGSLLYICRVKFLFVFIFTQKFVQDFENTAFLVALFLLAVFGTQSVLSRKLQMLSVKQLVHIIAFFI